MTTRIVYYIIHCTSAENQQGVFHYSEPFTLLEDAGKLAQKYRDSFPPGEGHVAIEQHHEVYDGYAWQIDHDRGGSEHVAYL